MTLPEFLSESPLEVSAPAVGGFLVLTCLIFDVCAKTVDALFAGRRDPDPDLRPYRGSRWGVILLALLLAAAPCHAQPAGWSWREVGNRPGWWSLHDAAGRQVGAYDVTTGAFHPLDPQAGKFREPCLPPDEVGLPPGVQANFGLIGDRAKFHKGEHFERSGVPMTRQQVLDLLGAERRVEGDKKIPDDASKPRVSVIGSPAACQPAMQALGKHKDQLVAVDYRPDAWQIKRQGFATPADPTIYVQAADGTVLRRLDGWQGEAALEQVIQEEVVRRPDPNYDPNKDSGWTKRLVNWGWGAVKAPVVWVAAAVVFLLLPFVFRKRLGA